jgi:hypothetical protein
MDVPFYPNDETNKHCFQATIHMVLGYFMPEHDFTMNELVRLSGSVDGMATWPSRMLLELDGMGFDIVMVEGFDGRDFIKRGAEYLRDTFGGDTAEWQIANSDIEKERSDYQQLYDRGIDLEKRIPDLEDIRRYMSDGYLVKCTVNSRRLGGMNGYVGHSVLVLSVSDDGVELHNPGLPACPNQKVSSETFNAAWAYPNDSAKSLIAVRPKENRGNHHVTK